MPILIASIARSAKRPVEARLVAREGRDRVRESWWTGGDEGLGVRHVDQPAVEPGPRLDRVEEALLGEDRLRLGRRRVVELAREAADRFHLRLEGVRHVHEERWLLRVARRVVD